MKNRMNRFESIPTIEDLAQALGLGQRPSMAAELAPAFGILVGGFVLGAMTALLLAPRSGQELRAELSERAENLRRRVRSTDAEGEPPVLKEL